MNLWSLMESLAAHLRNEFMSFPLPARFRRNSPVPLTTDGADTVPLRIPSIYIGPLDYGLAEMAEKVPFVLIQAIRGYEGEGLHHVELALRLAVAGEELDGAFNLVGAEQDLANLVSLTRRAVIGLKAAPLEGRYLLMADSQGRIAPWTRPSEQLDPFREAYIITAFAMKGVQ